MAKVELVYLVCTILPHLIVLSSEFISLFQGPVEISQGLVIWISLYYDDFGAFSTRNKSLGGLYLTVLNQPTKLLQRLDNVHLLALFPWGADFTSCWEIYRKELVHLEKHGFEVLSSLFLAVSSSLTPSSLQWVRPTDQIVQLTRVRLGIFKGDTPLRCQMCNHLSVGANQKCNKCDCLLEQIWDEDHPVASLRYRVGLQAAAVKLRARVGETYFQNVVFSFFYYYYF